MLKEALVGTKAGALVQAARGRMAVLGEGLSANPERAAMLANDVIGDRLVIGLCRPGDTFLDIGAHIGSIFSHVHVACPEATIYAVEADSDKAASLRNKFPYCTLFECAVGETPGTATFYKNVKKAGYSSLAKQADSVPQPVEIQTLDMLLPTEQIDIIKIDIEGAELGALKGASGLIARCHPVIFFESAQPGENALGYSPEAMWDWLTAAGYLLFVPDRLGHDGAGMARDVYIDSHLFPRRTRNYFAVHQDSRIAVRDRARSILKIAQ